MLYSVMRLCGWAIIIVGGFSALYLWMDEAIREFYPIYQVLGWASLVGSLTVGSIVLAFANLYDQYIQN